MAAAARAFSLSHINDLCPTPHLPHSSKYSIPAVSLPLLPAKVQRCATLCCLSGGVSDDFVSIRKSSFDRGFSVIANMLRRIEPLDTAVISKGVSDSAKDSMKQTISTMLGLLPSDQFSVTVRVSSHPLDRLLVSSIITGYTLWNAEYRIALIRNFDISPDNSKRLDCLERQEVSELDLQSGEKEAVDCRNCFDTCCQDLETVSPQIFENLSPEALRYIEQFQSELSTVKEELNAQKEQKVQIAHDSRNRSDLLDYLRSLDSDMVMELSRPSSYEVEDIIQQLAHNVLQKFFKENATTDFVGTENHQDDIDKLSRDYLAKLLFWCMLLGHHLRSLENRLQLSCVVGLL